MWGRNGCKFEGDKIKYRARALLATILSIALALMVVPSSAIASADVTPAELSAVSLASPRTVGPGEKVTFDWTITDASGISYLWFYLTGPEGKQPCACAATITARDGDTYHGTSTITVDTLTWPAGTWNIGSILIQDAAGNYTRLDPSSPALQDIDLSFTVEGTQADVTPAELSAVSLASPRTVGPGEKVTFDWTITDASGISYLWFYLTGPEGKQPCACAATITARDGDTYHGTSTITVDTLTWPAGTWNIGSILIQDAAGNYTRLDPSSPALQDIDLSFTVEGTQADVTPAELSAVSLASPRTVGPGEKVTFDWTITDASGISYLWFYLTGPEGKQPCACAATITARDGDTYHGTSTITVDTLTWPAGTWNIGSILIQDAAGNYTRLDPSSPALQDIDLSFTVLDSFDVAPAPVIKGTAAVAEDLSADPGNWVPQPESFSWQWYRDGQPIEGATNSTYTPAVGDYGALLQVGVTAALDGYTKTTRYSPAQRVHAGTLVVPPPTIAGTTIVGETLTASSSGWGSGHSLLSYQWFRGGMPVHGATGSTYTLAADDVDALITVEVTGIKQGYNNAVARSLPTAKIAPGTINSAVPKITGEPRIGSMLTAETGSWAPDGVSLAHQWFRDGAPIEGATESTYLLRSQDVGGTITVAVNGTKAGYIPDSRTSEPTDSIARGTLAAATPTITGTTTVGSTLTAVPGVWAPAGVDLTYQWLADGDPISGATKSTFDLAPAHARKVITVTVSGSEAGYTTESRTSQPTLPVATLVSPAAVVFTDKDGTAEDTYTVPATDGVDYLVGGKVVEAGTYPGTGMVTVTAKARTDFVLASGATAEWTATFKATPFQVSPAAVVFTDKDGTAEDTYTVPATDGVDYLVGGKVVEAGTYPGTGMVTVTAKARPDYVLASGAAAEWATTFKATPLPVSPAAVVFTDKDGTAEDTYTVPATDGVDYLVGGKVVEAGTYPGTGTVTVTAKARPDYVLASGAAAQWATTFKATPLPVSPAAVVFTDKDGTAEDTYTVPATDGVDYLVGGKVVEAGTYPGTGTVTVTAKARPDYVLASGAAAEWATTFKATPLPVSPAAVPTITGTTRVGYTLTANPGTWGPAPVSLTYQWYRSGTAITGATAATYRLNGTDAGKTISVRVTGAKTGYIPVTKSSAATAAVTAGTLAPAPVPLIKGTTRVGYTLTANPGTWGPAPVTLTYQWYRSGTAITGATAATYRLNGTDAGKTISVRVTGAKTGYIPVTKSSAATAAVTAGTLAPAPVPLIKGTTRVGYTLTANPGTWGPAPVTLTYQWYRSGTAITGATAATYRLNGTDAGKTISVRVTGAKTGYIPVTKSSAATAAVTAGTLAPAPVPLIKGTTRVGYTLTSNPGTWGPAPVSLTYQWYRSGTAITGATAATYRLNGTDAGKTISVRVTGAKTGYIRSTRTSASTPKIIR